MIWLPDVKVCRGCEIEKPLTEFSWRTDQNRHRARCRACDRVNKIAYRKRHPRRPRHVADYEHAAKIKARYGLAKEEYDRMLAAQNGVCAICLKACPRGRLSVDHDHTTGVVRGLLCRRCNSMLGSWGDSEENLERALNHLRGHNR